MLLLWCSLLYPTNTSPCGNYLIIIFLFWGIVSQHFDEDDGETVEYQPFLHRVRGTMNGSRREVVRLAFSILDQDGSGLITPEDLVGAYDGSRHPDVVAGKYKADEVRN